MPPRKWDEVGALCRPGALRTKGGRERDGERDRERQREGHRSGGGWGGGAMPPRKEGEVGALCLPEHLRTERGKGGAFVREREREKREREEHRGKGRRSGPSFRAQGGALWSVVAKGWGGAVPRDAMQGKRQGERGRENTQQTKTHTIDPARPILFFFTFFFPFRPRQTGYLNASTTEGQLPPATGLSGHPPLDTACT